MAIRKMKPMTPGTRWMSCPHFTEITKTKPEKSLIEPLKKSGGRNNTGRITSRHRGGGHKRFYRIIDFKRDKVGMDASVSAIEYDPNRSARIALLQYADGERRYIIAPDGVSVGDVLRSGPDAEIKVRQRDAAGEYSGRHVCPQYGIAARQRCADRTQCGQGRSS